MSFRPESLDLAELTATLVSEVRAGILAAEHRGEGHLEVTSATVRVGQQPAGAAGEEEPLLRPTAEPRRGPGAVVVPPEPATIVLQGPAAEAGWQVELELGEGEPLQLGGGHRPPAGTPATAFGLWSRRSPRVLKGIDDSRTTSLRRAGIETVGDLAALDEEAVAALVARLRSHRFLDFWVQASLLRAPVPRLAASSADGRRLADLAGRPPAQLRRLIGPHVCSTSSATQLFDLLTYWGTALNRRALSQVTLASLREAAQVGDPS
jgi:hypothetical protein